MKYYKFVVQKYFEEQAIELLNKKFDCRISSRSIVKFDCADAIIIGAGTIVSDFTVITVINDSLTNKRNSKLTVGKETYIGEQNNIRACGGEISIGDRCLISQQVSIIASNHSAVMGSPILSQAWSEKNNFVIIKDDVWIGCGVQILPGVVIESGSIIAAGSVVTKNVQSNAIYAGVPAKFIKMRE
ncbi:MAG: acyltransferase [Mucilaginibacter sp.]|uniref:acyltransferase n=1 Tax=Mucilaginibacter sp. TaxID=1882438 RepID=UPI003267C696